MLNQPTPPIAPAQWWESRLFAVALVIAAAVPLLYPQVPPLVDLLGHMGRYRVELDLAQSPDLQRYFEFHWQLIGNLGVDLLIIPLAKLVGLEMAVKLIAIAIPPLTVAGLLWVAREVHGRLPPTAAFALPFAFGHPFLFGFLNYTLSVALAFIAFGFWLRLGRLGQLRLRLALFVPISVLVFICHTFGWGILGLLCFSAEAVRLHDRGDVWWRAAFRAALQASVMAGPLALMLMWRSEVSHALTLDWFNWNNKGLWILTALRDRWLVIDTALLGLSVFILFVAIRSPRLTFSRNLAFSGFVLALMFALLPRLIFGSAYADMRLVPFIFATLLLSIRFKGDADRSAAQWFAVAAAAFLVVKIVSTTASLGIAAREQNRAMAALDHMPRGAAAISLVGEPCSTRHWALIRNAHLGAMATVRRYAFTNDQWAIEGANLLAIKYKQAAPFVADPSQSVRPNGCGSPWRRSVNDALRAIPRESVSHVWAIDLPDYDPTLLRGYHLVWEDGPYQLYARDQVKISP